jgi:hypothetical protein
MLMVKFSRPVLWYSVLGNATLIPFENFFNPGTGHNLFGGIRESLGSRISQNPKFPDYETRVHAPAPGFLFFPSSQNSFRAK